MSVFGLTPYEPGTPGGLGNLRGGGHPTIGTTRGQERPMSIPAWDKTDDDVEDDDDDDIEQSVKKALRKKIVNMSDSQSVSRVDLGARGKDPGNFVTNVGGIMMEYSDHTTPIMQGISPRITYRTARNTKGPAMSTQANAKYIRSMPGRQDGTLDG